METPVNYQKITKFPIHSKMLGLRLLGLTTHAHQLKVLLPQVQKTLFFLNNL